MNTLESKFYAKYSRYLSNFKTLSYDSSSKKSLCQNTTHKYYDFDKIVKKKYPSKHPASPDTLIFKNNSVYCVEFKNSTKIKTNKYKDSIQNKAQQGKETLLAIFKDLSINCENLTFIFCVVYKNPPKDNYAYASSIESRAIHFGLKASMPDFFSTIYTEPVDFFRDQFIEKIDQDLPC